MSDADKVTVTPKTTNPDRPAAAPPARNRQRLCSCLRWKGMYVEAEPDPQVPNTSDGLFWCTHTMNCLGPDGKVADREACTSGRSCFETLT